MANISVVVQDANNVQLNLTPAPATTLIAEGGNNVTLELTSTPTQVIELDRGVAGNGIASVSVVSILGSQYLRIVFTNGSTSDVGPIATSTYFGVSPIVVTGDQISLSTVPLALGGTGATTAPAARTNLGLGSIATQNSSSVTITGGSITGITDLAIADGGTGASTAANARTNLGLGTAAVLTAGAALGAATLDAGGTVPLSQIPASIQGGVSYQGTWNASTNTPTLTSSVGTKGFYYVVSVAGSTNLNGVTDWQIGDWAVFNGSDWQKIDNTDAVTSVNGFTGTVVLNAANVGAVSSVSGTGTVNGLTLTGTVTSTGDLTLGGTLDLSSPPDIGGTTPAAGTFTTLSTGTLTATGQTSLGGAEGSESLRVTSVASATRFITAQGNTADEVYLTASGPSGSNVALALSSRSTGAIKLFTNTNNQEQFRVAHTASAVNYVQVTGSVTGVTANTIPTISVQGSDATNYLGIGVKGPGYIAFYSGLSGNQAFRINTANASNSANRIEVNTAASGSAPSISVAGGTTTSDTNIDLALTPKGTGRVKFGTYTGTVLTPKGYVEIVDSGGTIRRLLVG